MKPVKGQSTAPHVRIVAGAAIALKMVVLAAYAAKKKRPQRYTVGDALPSIF